MIPSKSVSWIFLLTILGLAAGLAYEPESATSPPCLQPIVKGNCKGYLKQWGYDTASSKCISFVYTGCGGNQNRYKDENSCSEQCSRLLKPAINIEEHLPLPKPQPKPEILIERCNLPAAPGNCKRHQNLWYYDSSSGKCKRFVYTGCSGNQNRFYDEKACLATCSRTPIVLPAVISKKPEGRDQLNPDVKPAVNGKCSLPVAPGKCRLYEPSWHYDANEQTCKTFVYTGCLGNDNRFSTEENCLRECAVRRDQPPIIHPIPPVRPQVQPTRPPRPIRPEVQPTRLPPPVHRPQIQPTIPPPVHKPQIQPTRRPGPEILPIFVGPQCTGRPDPGMCFAHMPMWYYDSDLGTCKSFVYGGCGGNSNRHSSEQICLTTCKRSRPEVKPAVERIDKVNNEKCSQSLATGNCKSYINAWYFDNTSGKCKQFVYTGCKGNDNRFADERSCNDACSAKSPILLPNKDDADTCFLPVSAGNCKAHMRSWYYDAKTGTCKSFVYTGCQGNKNRFPNEKTCQTSCRAVAAVQRPNYY